MISIIRALRGAASSTRASLSGLTLVLPIQTARWPANIDHIAVAPSGVYVIDCKRYKGKMEVAEPLFGEAKLKINGRDRTKLIDGLQKAGRPRQGCTCQRG
jgi:hypothetical protein